MVLIPVALVLLVGHWLTANRENPTVSTVMRVVRLAVVGLIAAAALGLMTGESFGLPGLNRRFLVSVAIFAVVFLLAWRKRTSPVLLIVAAGVAGLVIYSF